jgi:hypothetical protein
MQTFRIGFRVQIGAFYHTIKPTPTPTPTPTLNQDQYICINQNDPQQQTFPHIEPDLYYYLQSVDSAAGSELSKGVKSIS